MARFPRIVRAVTVLLLSLAYVGFIFRIWEPVFWTAGLGDWMDPYFINYLLEHWRHSLLTLSDPASPPMFHPIEGTLGYSHGLILYVPFYLLARLFFSPLPAYNLTIFLVIELGVISLYIVFRRFMSLTFAESLLLTAFFVTSANVLNGWLGVWTQRASVFLVPLVLLAILTTLRTPEGRWRTALAFASGLIAALLFSQDFYSAQFTLLMVAFAAAPFIPAALARNGSALRRIWTTDDWLRRLSVVVAIAAGLWAWCLATFGGVTVSAFGMRIASNNWRRPALLALVATIGYLGLRWRSRRWRWAVRAEPWLISMAVGVLLGAVVFLWIHLRAYLEFPGFPSGAYNGSLIARDPARWTNALDMIRDLEGFPSLRPFALVAILAVMAWMPGSTLDSRTRRLVSWAVACSLIVLLTPLRFGEVSVWRFLFAPIPGFSAIRDPTRIVYQYELAVAIFAGLLIARLPVRSTRRLTITLLVLCLTLWEPSRTRFDFLRPANQFARWVQPAIDVDLTCRSFVMKPAPDEYTQRSADRWMLYSIDAMFIALQYSIPTLHGYSAWTPTHWNVRDPDDPNFSRGLSDWIERHHLRHVCGLDLDERTMRPLVDTGKSIP